MVTVQDVKERWEKIQGDDERILFIVGGPGSGKSLLIVNCLSRRAGNTWKLSNSSRKSFCSCLVMNGLN